VLAKTDGDSKSALVDAIEDEAEQKGTGRWTSESALQLGVPLTGITEAVFARVLSSQKAQRVRAAGVLGGPAARASRRADPALLDDVRDALYASKIVAYAQGFEHLRAGSSEFGWNLDLGALATIWRGGCIIRARFLNRITDALRTDPAMGNLMLDPFFKDLLNRTQQNWREVVALAVSNGIPVPAFSASLAYYDSYRTERLPANLLQAQRDFFGAHTYERTDKTEGRFFHTEWPEVIG
jgi:6-phosphogluconate dehydrogenase